MPTDAPVNTGARDETAVRPFVRVSEMQAKLHRWAAADPGRRFDDLFNFVCDPATLIVALDRVAGNTGSRTAGVDGLTVADVEEQVGAPGFLEDLRAQLKAGTFRPLPVRERKIPKPGGSGKLRKLSIPTVADRVVQAALKLVLEPIFEADFEPVSYGFRPMRRAQDAIAEIHQYGTQGYRWVLDADIEACFDSIDHTALMGRVRRLPVDDGQRDDDDGAMLVVSQMRCDRTLQEVVHPVPTPVSARSHDDHCRIDRASQMSQRPIRATRQVSELPGHRLSCEAARDRVLQVDLSLPPLRVIGEVRVQVRVQDGAVGQLAIDDTAWVDVGEVDGRA